MKTVLYVSPLPPPAGGIGTWTRILLEKGLPGGYAPRIVDSSIGPERPIFQATSLAAELRRGLRILFGLLRELLTHRPRLLHINADPLARGFYRDLVCALLGRLFGVPVVIHYRGLVAKLREQPERRLHQWALRRGVHIAALNLVLNRDSLEFVEAIAGPAGERVESLPNYYDESGFGGARAGARGEGERPRVLFVAGLTRAKGTLLALEVARALPEVDFHLLGPAYPEVEEALGGRPGNVALHGEVDHATVIREMAASHLLLFPSSHEGFPNAVLEAMVLGLPVVATAVGAIPEMIEDGRGGRLVARDAAALTEAVREVLADEAARAAMGSFNRAKAEAEYAFPAVAARLASLYDEVLGDEVPGDGLPGDR